MFDAITGFTRDRIQDFDVSEGDQIDISDLLFNYDSLTDDITDFVRITGNTNSDLRVDVTGSGTFGSSTRVATIVGVNGLTDEAALEANGTLITM